MVRKINLSFVAALVLFFSALFISNKIAQPVQAQSGTPTTPNPQVWRCLKGDQVGGQTRTPPPELNVQLTGKGFPTSQDIYVVGCQSSSTWPRPTPPITYKCTTDNPEFDRQLFGSDLSTTLNPF